MTFDDMLPRVRPYVTGCPPQTMKLHLVDAAKAFCRRTLAWNVAFVQNTVAGQTSYTLALPAATALVRVLACDLNSGTSYHPQFGGRSRAAVRSGTGYVCAVTAPATVALTPAPPTGAQPLSIEAALQPDDSGATVWPDLLAEHVEFIAAGAIGSLAVLPGAWRDPQTAADQRAKFEARVAAVYHRVAQSVTRSPRAIRPSF